jgi:hypothetical protein
MLWSLPYTAKICGGGSSADLPISGGVVLGWRSDRRTVRGAGKLCAWGASATVEHGRPGDRQGGDMQDLTRVVAARDEWLNVLANASDLDVRVEAERRLRACRAALEIVNSRLGALGYPVQPIVANFPIAVSELCRRLEDVGVSPPPMLALVWEEAGEISVVDIPGYAHCEFWERRNVGYVGENRSEFCDGLHIDSPLRRSVDSYIKFVAEEHFVWIDSGDKAGGFPFEFPIAPDGYHKDDISGGQSYAVVPGTGAWDHRLVHFGWRNRPVTAPEGPPDLLSYLRTAILECGCFPGFLGSATYEADRRYLTADLPVF